MRIGVKLDVPKWGIIAGIFVAIPTAFLAIVQVWNLIGSARPNIVGYQQTVPIELPSTYRKFLQTIDRSQRKDLADLVDAGPPGPEASKIRFGASLETLKEFSSSIPVLGSISETTIVKVANTGGKSAGDVKVIFPSAGYVEIQKDGAALRNEETAGSVELHTLEPSSRCVIKFWRTSFIGSGDVRVVSDGAIVPVQPEFVSREENKWVIAFGWPGLLLVLWLVPMLVILWGSFVAWWRTLPFR